MSKILLIPDIHLKHIIAQRIIDSVEYDLVVFLGDEMDDFNDTLDQTRATALWLKESLHNPRHIHLWGNHLLPYAFPSPHTYCSGYTEDKQRVIDEVMKNEDWALFKPFYYITEGNWLLSHAGINRHIFECPQRGLTLEVLKEKCERGLASLAFEQHSYEFGAGWSRGGRQQWPGLTWQDFSELVPLREFKQICGHSIRETPQVRFFGKSGQVLQRSYDRFNGWTHPEIAVDIDCNSRFYVVLEDGKLSIFEMS